MRFWGNLSDLRGLGVDLSAMGVDLVPVGVDLGPVGVRAALGVDLNAPGLN